MQDTSAPVRRSRRPSRPRAELDAYTLERMRADRFRHVAYRQGLVLVKSRLRKHQKLGYGIYHLVPMADQLMAKSSPTYTIDEIDALLNSGDLARPDPAEWRTQKPCSRCGETKPLDQFYRHQSALDGYQALCKTCSNERYAAYFIENKAVINERSRRNMKKKRDEDPDYTAKAHLWSLFRMTLEEYEARLAGQGGVCAICGTPPGTKRLAVDHDRKCCPGARSCGKCVRALLCSGCNNSTGITDDPFLLRRKADYIELWRFRHAEAAAQAQ